MSGEESFLRRWSRRKAERRQAVAAVPSPKGEAGDPKRRPAASDKALAREAEKEIELPPIDSLTKDSDFTVFLREGVPEALKQQALRKLWASDPAFGAPDVLDIHAQDYSQLGRTPEVVKTAYRIGKGFAEEAAKPEEEASPDGPERAAAAGRQPTAAAQAAGEADVPPPPDPAPKA
mgnify:CR=1 FL=1|jgi:hypothetical protein